MPSVGGRGKGHVWSWRKANLRAAPDLRRDFVVRFGLGCWLLVVRVGFFRSTIENGGAVPSRCSRVQLRVGIRHRPTQVSVSEDEKSFCFQLGRVDGKQQKW
ncbi:hypothetical protein BRADI_5g04563v3 [Brachypodium distachyon]|uniref:Uncharacterized protein n=1 Tax=Brachypodium distachyon TaxID=15368 RepID=A0A2K2CFG7_BRADI|nr:hypothetical protein BRADI_5g04563v3 [Brachypodium distachyon]